MNAVMVRREMRKVLRKHDEIKQDGRALAQQLRAAQKRTTELAAENAVLKREVENRQRMLENAREHFADERERLERQYRAKIDELERKVLGIPQSA